MEGRRSITSATLSASSERSGNSASMATLSNDDGWCSSGQQRTAVPSIYLQVNFNADVLISAVVTEGFSGFFTTYFTQQYKVQIAGSSGSPRFVATSTDSSVAAVSQNTTYILTTRPCYTYMQEFIDIYYELLVAIWLFYIRIARYFNCVIIYCSCKFYRGFHKIIY